MTRIVIDVGAIGSLGSDLITVSSEFEYANAHSDGIASAVGHPGLADTVRDFAHKWDDTRKAMVDGLRGLGQAASAVSEAWVDFDQQGADALTGSGDQGPASPPPQSE